MNAHAGTEATFLLREIPLGQLARSALNVRQAAPSAAEDAALVASIQAIGLINPLVVVEKDLDAYEVVAGGRRLAALKTIHDNPEHTVACMVVQGGEAVARTASLAENFARAQLTPLDECDAFTKLRENLTAEEIAATFAVTVRYVEQRLALSALIPAVRKTLIEKKIGLDVAAALTLLDEKNQGKWAKAFKAGEWWAKNPEQLRTRILGDGFKRKEAIFDVTASGLELLRDLFTPEDEWLFVDSEAFLAKQREAVEARAELPALRAGARF